MNFLKGAHQLRIKLYKELSQLGSKVKSADWNNDVKLTLRMLVNRDWQSTLRHYRFQAFKGVASAGIIAAITIGGNHYVQANTTQVYDVYVSGHEVGVVDNPQIVNEFTQNKAKKVQEESPNVHMVVDLSQVTIKSERAFKPKSNDNLALAKLDQMLVPHAVGVQLVIDGKVVATVKDQAAANAILTNIKSRYLPVKEKKSSTVTALSVGGDETAVSSKLKEVGFVQDVETKSVDNIHASEVMSPADVVKKLETGDVQPTKYTVVEGDCISCIAQKFNISQQVIYDNNPSISDDMLQIGQVLNLTVLQPMLSIKTVENLVEDQPIQFDTNYTLDNTMRAGVVKVTSPGTNGMKEVTYAVTKINGQMQSENVVSEQVITPPITEEAIKGTLVIKGEGTGKFRWPIANPDITSPFGMRWGRLHKGVDIVSNDHQIKAADNGVVIYAGYASDYGDHVILDHLNGYKTVYAHLRTIKVKVGDILQKGDLLGVMGETGDATGVHLHFEIRVDNVVQNPLKYLSIY